MKRVLFPILVLAMIVTTSMTVAVKAQTLTYDSCFQIQNLSNNPASVIISYYQQGTPNPVASPHDTIPANSSKTYCPLSAVSSGFNGSIVISSDQPVVAIVNVTGGAWSAFDASYAGFTSGATTVYIPLLMKNNYGYNTWFNVQNVGSSPATVYVTYSDGTTAGPVTLQPNLATTFNQAIETHNQPVFAATVTSTQPIVITVMEVGPRMLFGYNGFTAASPNPVMPLVQANNYGYTTGIQVQNVGTSATQVTISYTPSAAGTACTQTKTINPGSSETFALHAWSVNDTNVDNNCVNGQTFVGSAKVTGNTTNQPLVAIVNQHNFSTNKGAAYGAFDPASATSKVVLPLIMDRNYGYFTGFNIQNVGTSATTVTCVFANSARTVSKTLQPGEALTDVQLNQLANGYVGSAVCTASGGDAKIIGVVNELLNVGIQDTFLVYEAFNVEP